MKKIVISLGLLFVLSIIGVTIFLWRHNKPSNTTNLQLTGSAGSAFTGYYVRHGQHITPVRHAPLVVEHE